MSGAMPTLAAPALAACFGYEGVLQRGMYLTGLPGG